MKKQLQNSFLFVLCLFAIITHAQNVGIGTTTPVWKLDVRGSTPDDGQLISVGNSDQTHHLLFFGGRLNDPNPFILWKAGDPLRFATDEFGYRELMRINPDGSVGIGTLPNASAILDVASSSQGLLIPRMSTSIITSVSNPAKGLMIYDSTKNQLMVNMGTPVAPNWQTIVYSSGWSLTGNSGINPLNNFIGTTDVSPIIFKVNNSKAGIVDTTTNNTSLGFRTLDSVTTGVHNAALGYKALISNKAGLYNTAIGSNALRYNTSGNYNTAVGMQSLTLNTTGYRNTALGYLSMYLDTSGFDNTSSGVYSLYSNFIRCCQCCHWLFSIVWQYYRLLQYGYRRLFIIQ